MVWDQVQSESSKRRQLWIKTLSQEEGQKLPHLLLAVQAPPCSPPETPSRYGGTGERLMKLCGNVEHFTAGMEAS